jgi:hypothetical protein
VFVGVGLLAFLHLIQPDEMIWAVALMPIFAGVALLLSALIVRPRNGRNSSGS